MYDVAQFIKPVPMNTERSGEFFGCEESQSLEFFRYERSRTFLAELIREKSARSCHLTLRRTDDAKIPVNLSETVK